MNTSKAQKVGEAMAFGAFIGMDIWIVITLAADFMVLFMVAVPVLSVCFLINEVIKLWRR
jgi:hypothetical protein